MEVVGAAASIVALLQLTGKVASIGYSYTTGVKRAPKDVRELLNELNSLTIVLDNLQDYVDANPQSPTLQKLGAVGGPLLECINELEELRRQLETTDSSGFIARCKWPLKEKETTQSILKIERYKSMFTLALNVNHASLSQEIKICVEETGVAVQDIKADVRDTTLAVHEVKGNVQGIKGSVEDTSIAVHAIKGNIDMALQDKTRRDVLNWLYSEPFDKRHTEIKDRRRENTGEWLLKSPEFREWLKKNPNSPLLWGHGIPGAGKTFLSSRVIDYLLDEAQTSNYGVAYVYFDYNEQNQQKPIHVLASLVKQLASQLPQLPTYITDLKAKHTKEGDKRPTVDELYSCLLSTLKSFSQTFLVFDALDECNQKSQRKGLLPLFHRMGKSGINVFLTSRQHPEDIQYSFRDSAKTELRANDEDVKQYIQQKIDEHPRAKRLVERGGCEDKIISELTNCARGMFLLVHFHIEYICEQPTVKKILKELQILKDSTTDQTPLDPTYDRAMVHIRTQHRSCTELATKVFSWLVKARRTLTVDELRMAVSVEPKCYEFDDLGADLPDKETLLDVCAGLVMIDEKTNSIRLVHYTVQEYLLKNSVIPENASFNLVMACTTFLSFDVFAKGACTSPESLRARYNDYPFLKYAAGEIPFHLKQCDEALSTALVLKFLESPGNIASYIQAVFVRSDWMISNRCTDYPERLPLHVASTLGHQELLQTLLDQVIDISIPDSSGSTALHLAAENGHEAVVRLLLEKGADISAKGEYQQSVLHVAAGNGHEAVVRLLLEKGADTSAEDRSQQTALHKVAGNGHEAVVRLLLEKGADISAKDKDQQTALHLAAGNGHEAVVRLLLEKGADISAKGEYQQSVLHVAAGNGHETVVRLLLEKGADISAKSKGILNSGGTALHLAAENGHEAVVRLLLEKGADISAKSKGILNSGGTALHLAAGNGHEAVVRLLLEKGADISAKSGGTYSSGETALHLAAENGYEAVVRLLLEKGADISAKSKGILNLGGTALHLAAGNGHEAVVRLLLEKGADISAKDRYQRTALYKAAGNGHEAVVRLLLEKGADISAEDWSQQTALHNAAGNGHEAVVRLLLEKGADISAEGRRQQTILHLAARNGYEAMVRLLLEKGADISAKDAEQETALYTAARGDKNRTGWEYEGERSYVGVIKLLLENSATQTEHVEQALQVAETCKEEKIAQILRTALAERHAA